MSSNESKPGIIADYGKKLVDATKSDPYTMVGWMGVILVLIILFVLIGWYLEWFTWVGFSMPKWGNDKSEEQVSK